MKRKTNWLIKLPFYHYYLDILFLSKSIVVDWLKIQYLFSHFHLINNNLGYEKNDSIIVLVNNKKNI